MNGIFPEKNSWKERWKSDKKKCAFIERSFLKKTFPHKRNMYVSVFTCIWTCANCANKHLFIRFTATERRKSLWLFVVSCHSLAQCFVSLKHRVILSNVLQTVIGKWSLMSYHGTVEGVDHLASHYPGTLQPSSCCQKVHCTHHSKNIKREERKWHPITMHDLVLASVPRPPEEVVNLRWKTHNNEVGL